MNVNAVVLCPIRPGTNKVFIENQERLIKEAAVYAGNRGMIVHVIYGNFELEGATPVTCHVERARHISAVRNAMILDLATKAGACYALAELTHVIWMDVDIVRYAPDLFFKLLLVSTEHNAVTAPRVLLDDSSGKTHPGRWYDTAGFIHRGMRATLGFPWFTGERNDEPLPELLEVDGSVGCVYCVPWKVYENGASHHFDTERTTEHYPVCQFARRMGMKLLVLTKETAWHAYLPDYGEAFH